MPGRRQQKRRHTRACECTCIITTPDLEAQAGGMTCPTLRSVPGALSRRLSAFPSDESSIVPLYMVGQMEQAGYLGSDFRAHARSRRKEMVAAMVITS